jgi:two-component system OmpR family response regulator
LEELSARVRSQLRQHQSSAGHDLRYANLVLDPQAKTLMQEGQSVNLTAKEFQILHKLMQKPEHVMTREQLEESLYAWGDEIESNAIEVFIYQLRKKIGSQYIKTIRGLGYRMSQD